MQMSSEGAFCPSEELMKKSCLGNFKILFLGKNILKGRAPADSSFGYKE
jgi:hypothetical protein